MKGLVWPAAAVAYAVLTVLMTWPFTNYGQFAQASYGGDQRLIIWTLAWDNHAVLNGLSLFDANIFFPAAQTLRYNEHLLGVSLATLPLAAAGASPVLAHNVVWLAAFFLNGCAAFAWLRRFGLASLAAFAGSLVFACSFYVMLHVHAHLHLVWMWPLPLSALLLERWFIRPTPWRLAGWLVVALVGVLTSWYIAVILAVVNAVVALALVLTNRPREAAAPAARDAARPCTRERPAHVWRSRILQGVGAAAIAAAVVYPMARPYVGIQASPGEAALHAADVASYVIPPQNTVVGRWWMTHIDNRPRSIYGEQTLFVGWIALALAAIGLASLVRRGRGAGMAWVFPALAVVGFLISLGPAPSVLGGSALAPFAWMTSMPGFSGMRAPGRFALICTLGLAGLTGLGAQAMHERWRTRGAVAVLALIPLMLAEWFVVDFPAGKPELHSVPAIYASPEVRSARALASLPEYRDQPDWFQGGDYLYYSTAHWRPIVNGFGRSEPPDQPAVIAAVRAFAADPDAVAALGVQFVIVHGARLASADRHVIDDAVAHPRIRLVSQVGSDYLFELVGGR